MTGNSRNHKIVILLATYNSSQYLKEQLDSLINQSYKNILIVVRDDGSKDNTIDILNNYIELYPEKVTLLDSSSSLGPKNSFFSLLNNVDAEYYMFCDHDDVWLPTKVEDTYDKMKEAENCYGKQTPILVHTDLRTVDQDLNILMDSYYYKFSPKDISFGKLLYGNVCVGCTEMLNDALKKRTILVNDSRISMHDYWLALIASAFGHIIFLDKPTILYRQHKNNTVGYFKPENVLTKILKTSFNPKPLIKQMTTNRNNAIAFYELYQSELSQVQIETIKAFIALHEMNIIQKHRTIQKHGFYHTNNLFSIIGRDIFM